MLRINTLKCEGSPSGKKIIGRINIDDGASSVTVTGLNLSFNPEQVRVQLEKPTGGAIVLAVLNYQSVSNDGFIAEFTATVSGDEYVLSFEIL